ncbi:MAG: PKD domain-containing protein [Candidatus Omnitrophota bacterium]|jgi:murein DD-endopeptidase MepM/ murein hydrolase activator NlpD|nr:MAG: PKD domain-containing protein [Candidatus Omnitrophota bacterium]
MQRIVIVIVSMIFITSSQVRAKPVTVDLAVGESYVYQLKTGEEKKITVLACEDVRDEFRNAVRQATVTVDVDGVQAVIPVAQYTMPRVVNGVKLDAPVIKAYLSNSGSPAIWDLAPDADVRLRCWDPDQPLLEPGTFCYPVKQRWFASQTQMANEPTFVDGGEDPRNKSIYYHYALDFGGYDQMVRVVAATDGDVVSVAGVIDENLPPEGQEIVQPRYDVIYLRDDRGWYYRYSHFAAILPQIKIGYRVKMGEWIGILGKEGASGGWSHLHFGIHGTQGDEKGLIEAYPFAVEAYLNEHPNSVLAVARPHQLVKVGDAVFLNGSNSICDNSEIVAYEWEFHDGTKATGPIVKRVYKQAGVYSEILKVKDNRGQVDVDFAVVHVLDGDNTLTRLPPSIHAAYFPTESIQIDDTVYFKARAFRVTGGREEWDFGDGQTGTTCSKDEFAAISHYYEKPGLYIVTVKRTSQNGTTAMAQLKVFVEDAKR